MGAVPGNVCLSYARTSRIVSCSLGHVHSVHTVGCIFFGVPHRTAPNTVEGNQGRNMGFLVLKAHQSSCTIFSIDIENAEHIIELEQLLFGGAYEEVRN